MDHYPFDIETKMIFSDVSDLIELLKSDPDKWKWLIDQLNEQTSEQMLKSYVDETVNYHQSKPIENVIEELHQTDQQLKELNERAAPLQWRQKWLSVELNERGSLRQKVEYEIKSKGYKGMTFEKAIREYKKTLNNEYICYSSQQIVNLIIKHNEKAKV